MSDQQTSHQPDPSIRLTPGQRARAERIARAYRATDQPAPVILGQGDTARHLTPRICRPRSTRREAFGWGFAAGVWFAVVLAELFIIAARW